MLAILTNCKSMIEAFKVGGDFHSRTAATMFDNIKKELEAGTLLMEKPKDPEDKRPVVKDKYANERKKAKTMNFSVAYGKSAFGFAKDWNCTVQEAEKFVELWYKERPEVKEWQELQKRVAVEKGYTRTLMGRYRNLTKHFSEFQKMRALHGLRAAINTPVQGGAADIVIAAMVKISKNQQLRDLGYEMLLQIHDELVLEGPAEKATEALAIVKECMENPIDFEFPVKLEVDAKICDNWSESK